MDPVHGGDSNEHKKILIEDTVIEDDKANKPISEHKPEIERSSSSSSSSSPCSSSDEDFFQIDPAALEKQNPVSSETTNKIPGHPQQDANPEPALEVASHNGGATGSPVVVNLMDDDTMHAASPPPDRPSSPDVLISSSEADLLEPKQSPPIQVMGRSDVPDPNRIPSSIFARSKSTTPVEWSMASNESLFSIHVGNSSFSRDHALFMKSGELTNFSGYPSDPYAPLPPSPCRPSANATDSAHELKQTSAAEANAEAMKHVLRANAEVHSHENNQTADGEPFSKSVSHRSDGSTASFAFPVLTGDERIGSLKAEPERPAPPPQEPKPPAPQTETPKAAPPPPAAENTRWFSCLSCCPFCG